MGATWRKRESARGLRKDATDAEARAWELLRNRRCLGLKFRRQHAVCGFIVDFYCAELHLAVKVDGAVHRTPEGIDRDAARTAILESTGLRVIRLANELVSPRALERIVWAVTRPRPPGVAAVFSAGGAPRGEA